MSVNPDSSRASRRRSPEIVAAIVVLLTGEGKPTSSSSATGPLSHTPEWVTAVVPASPGPGE